MGDARRVPSGPVVRKLAAAKELGLEKNVAALEAVQPEPIDAADISVRLGSTWVPADVYTAFVERITGAKARVTFMKALNSFSVNGNARPSHQGLSGELSAQTPST